MPAAFARWAISSPTLRGLLGAAQAAHDPDSVQLRGGQGAAGLVVDQLGEDPVVGAEHGQARTRGGPDDLRAHTPAALQAARFLRLDAHARLPTFRATYSPS